MQELRNEVVELKTQAVLISSEMFVDLKDELSLNKLREGLYKICDNLSIIAYFRRQDIWRESFYSQEIKAAESRLKKEFRETVYDSKQLTWLFYDKFLQRWQSYFPDAKIIPRIYDRNNLP
ncbi:MAG: hypothetical protein NC904_08680, partial [Candidatus Omnitrophica bacterium]|nr:hypothetical protein [Candidatus Omnitrophota bacterium]